MPESLLLDTHAWIWVLEDDARTLPIKSRSERLIVPAICVWEVGLLVAKSRIQLEPSVSEWVRRGLAPPTELLPLSPAIALLANNLRGTFHGDPADRIIVASAIATGDRLATADRAILRYAARHGIATLPLK